MNDIASAKKHARRLHVEDRWWLVYELSAQYDRRGASLVFESEDLVRRVRDYPPSWRELTDAALARLMGTPGDGQPPR